MLQIFVTKNGVLCNQVKKNFQELCHGESVVRDHIAMEEDQPPHKLHEV